MTQELSVEIFNLIEQVVKDYALEKSVLENNPKIAEDLSTSDNQLSTTALKILYENDLKGYDPAIRPTFVSLAIYNIVRDIINKEVATAELNNFLETLNLSPKTIQEITKKIFETDSFKKGLVGEDNIGENNPEEKLPFQKKSGLSQELQ